MMKINKILAGVILTSFLITPVYSAERCEVTSHFSPQESIEKEIAEELLKAKKSVKISLFALTNDDLVDILIDLHNNGVQVEIGIDMRRFKGDDVPELMEAGIPVYIKKTWALQHNKFAIIDDKTVVMGSWNWSKSADYQDNSIVILEKCPQEINKFVDTFNWIKERDTSEEAEN